MGFLLSAAELTAAHFGGGGSLQKSSQWPTREAESLKSRRELIEELIARSKQEKVPQAHDSYLRVCWADWGSCTYCPLANRKLPVVLWTVVVSVLLC